MIIVETISVAS